MAETTPYIRIGFFSDFKDYDTLLISVDRKGILEIEGAFENLSKGTSEFDFSTLSALDKQYHVELIAYVDTNNFGLNEVGKNKYEWRLTPFIWNQFKEITAVLGQSDHCGHHYLDFESNYFNKEENFIDLDSLQVILSLDEYPLSLWEEHFGWENG
jgi:hypothetical protein